MPLLRTTITAASRIMLPTYVVLLGGLGANYGFTHRRRLIDSPALDYANNVLPLPAWGVIFLVVAALMAAAMSTHSRTLYRYALWLGIVCMVIWATVFLLAAFRSNASPGAWLWPAFAACAFYATNRSLLAGEE